RCRPPSGRAPPPRPPPLRRGAVVWTSPCGAPTRHYQGRNRETITWAEAAIADAEASGDPSLLATAHLHLELAHSMLGDGLAAGHGTKAVALFEAAGDRTGLTHA